MAADIKAEKDAKKGKGKGDKGDKGEKGEKGKGSGRGGGRGRGRGRGRKAAVSSASQPEIPEVTATPEHPPRASKRDPPADLTTPERRVLFPEEPEIPKASPAKPPKKRVRGKKSAAVETPEVEAPQEGDMTEVPKAKAKAKAKQHRKGKHPEAKAVIEGKSEGDEKDKVEGPTEGKERKVSKAAQQAALKCLQEAKADEASWFHAEKLFEALKGKKLENKRDVPKFDHWSLSVYWSSSRVGLLQKQQKRFQHVLSFGGVYCKNIAMPVLAASMYVTRSYKLHMLLDNVS